MFDFTDKFVVVLGLESLLSLFPIRKKCLRKFDARFPEIREIDRYQLLL